MIGIVIVAHGGLAGEFCAALEHVVGPQEQLEPFAIGNCSFFGSAVFPAVLCG